MVAGNPLLLNVVDLRRVAGTSRRIDIDEPFADLELSTVRVPNDQPVHLALTLESASGSVSADGTLTVPWVGECRRCLEPVAGQLTIEVAEVFEDRPNEGETYPIVNDQIDLEPLVRELVLLSIPLNPLCSEDCAGPIPDEIPVTVEDSGVEKPKKDPRWAALDALRGEDG
ncbi:MAG: DUF177 domain-containing protein [Actinobacteria bacterium]|nr:DUF177 domain-containing protein [Actinomycetota bacterium]